MAVLQPLSCSEARALTSVVRAQSNVLVFTAGHPFQHEGSTGRYRHARMYSLHMPCCCVSRDGAGCAGKDSTQDFEEIGHSNSARELLEKYIIGEYAVSGLLPVPMLVLVRADWCVVGDGLAS